MSPKAQQAAIAKACSWREAFPANGEPHDLTKRGGILLPYYWVNEITKERRMELPDYLNDLNACHEMEKTLLDNDTPSGRWGYIDQLVMITGAESLEVYREAFVLAHAAAIQRAEAFLRVHNLYDSSK
jgi:hypothetical protein